MLVPPPNGITTASASSAALQDPGDRRLVGRAHDDVGHAAEVAAALADEVAQALAARVDDAVERVVGDVRRRRRRAPARRAARRPAAAPGCRGRRSAAAGTRSRRRRCRGAADERPKRRLVVVGEGDALVAPAPPLHRTVLAGSCRRCGHGLDLTQGAPGVGLEPTTYRLTADRSAIELPRTELPRIIGREGDFHATPPRPPRGSFRTVARISGPPRALARVCEPAESRSEAFLRAGRRGGTAARPV